MTQPADRLPGTPVLSVGIAEERDVVTARQRARRVCAFLGFSQQDQTRVSTAVSEIARNAYQYAGGGRLDFSIDLEARPQMLWLKVSDRGPGIRDLDAALGGGYVSATGMGIGLAGSSRLMDEFHVCSSPGQGTTVRFGKAIPASARAVDQTGIGTLCALISQEGAAPVTQELERQNREILQTLELLRVREAELERREQELARLNLELEETNRGVVALYAELDEKAVDLRRAGEIKSRFLSHASHEFRTPVNSILALTRLLLTRQDGELAPEQEKQISYIRDAAQQLADIVNDLLDLAKVESGKTELQFASVHVNQFLGATRALMRPLATNPAVALVVEDAASQLVFETDESKVGQILRNLISNALKFTELGEVRVTAGVSDTGDAIVFTVKDTGIGIHPKDQERVFQEFSQVENPIQKQVKGTGLGLSLSRRLAVLLGGSLAMESKVNVGSTFTLTLPFRLPSGMSVAEASAGPGVAPQKGILIVDDEEPARYLAHRLFRGTGCYLVDSDGFAVAERARFENPALILLDLAMPGRSGFDVLDELKSDEKTAHIPVVIHTSTVLSEADYRRLAGRQIAVLPKGPSGRLPALLAIRAVLGEPDLFAAEPEFS